MRKIIITVLVLTAVYAGCSGRNEPDLKVQQERMEMSDMEQATFAGGCFWCMEEAFENMDGVISVVSGYSGGELENPTYEEVSSGTTGHLEAIQITYDPTRISFASLLNFFWRQIDPTDNGGSFVDRGPQYRSAVFIITETRKRLH